MKENSINNWEKNDTKTYQQPDAEETERFGTEICEPKNTTKRPNG